MPPQSVLIGDHSPLSTAAPPSGHATGLVPRDFSSKPFGSLYFAKPFSLPLIPRNEWADRIAARQTAKAQLSDVRNLGNSGQPIPSRDQDGKGYCLPAGFLVRMADGSKKPIENVKIGEMVLGSDLKSHRVGETHQRLYSGEIKRLVIDGCEALAVTEDHMLSWGSEYAETVEPSWFDVRADLFKAGHRVRRLIGESFVPARVQHVSGKQVKDLPVFDIGVEDDHHFLVGDDILSHNCWAHSGVSAHLVVRALMNEPYADLSAFAIACMIKHFRDEGGDGSEGVEFQSQKGCPTSQFWPQQSMSRSNDNTNTWANAALHKYVTWMELDPDSMLDQLVTAVLSDCPVVSDFNWWCFPSGTLVRMADGSEKPIDKFQLGDMVVSASGNVQQVLTLYKRRHVGKISRIVLHGNNTVEITSNHKLPILRNGSVVEVPAGELTNLDYVRIPKYMPQEKFEYLHVYDFLEKEKKTVANKILSLPVGVDLNETETRSLVSQYEKMTKRDQKQSAGNTKRWGSRTDLPDLLKLDYKLGRVFGLWLAEGSCNKYHVEWSFHLKEEDTLGKEVVDFLHSIGAKAVLERYPEKNVLVVRDKGSNLCQLISSLFFGNVYTKFIHADMFGGPDEFLRGMLLGWLDGDGTKESRGSTSMLVGCTVSKILALNMYDIANYLGYQPSLTVEKPSSTSTRKMKKYKVGFVLERSKILSAKRDYRLVVHGDGHTYRRVKSVQDIDYDGYVYNIEVEQDHSYIAQGIAVNNCHSVCTVDAKDWDGSQLTSTIWNSWGDKWSANGMGDLQGRKAIPDSAIAACVITPSQI